MPSRNKKPPNLQKILGCTKQKGAQRGCPKTRVTETKGARILVTKRYFMFADIFNVHKDHMI